MHFLKKKKKKKKKKEKEKKEKKKEKKEKKKNKERREKRYITAWTFRVGKRSKRRTIAKRWSRTMWRGC